MAVFLTPNHFLTIIMPMTKLKIPMKPAIKTAANHLFCCKNQFLFLVLDNAKFSLIRCTFSLLTTQSKSLNDIGFARSYSIRMTSSSYDSPYKSFIIRMTWFSDRSTSVTEKWSSDSLRYLPCKSANSILIYP